MDFGSRILRIGIFYDGNYFYHVSNYYCYAHPRRSRLSIPGLHAFIKKLVAQKEGVDERFCQIVDCHYFRGRLPAKEAYARQILLNERIFDDILMREGVVTHYLPMSGGAEKGVDVALSLETLELTLFKNFNVVVLIASDGDYVPLVRKLNAIGTRVMVLGWDFEYTDYNGNTRFTTTSAKLLNESSYPIDMQKIIDEGTGESAINVDCLFVNDSQNGTSGQNDEDAYMDVEQNNYNAGQNVQNIKNMNGQRMTEYGPGIRSTSNMDADGSDQDPVSDNIGNTLLCYGRVVQLKNGYGFIAPEREQQQNESKNLFFFWEDVANCDFNELRIGDRVSYIEGHNERGECAREVRLIQ